MLVPLPLEIWGRQRAVDVGLETGSWGIWAWDVARTVALVALTACGSICMP